MELGGKPANEMVDKKMARSGRRLAFARPIEHGRWAGGTAAGVYFAVVNGFQRMESVHWKLATPPPRAEAWWSD